MAKTPENSKKTLSRRGFMQKAAGAAITAGAVSQTAKAGIVKNILPSSVLGANEKILTGHIGTGGMGRADLKFAMTRDDMKPIALCDLYDANLERGAKLLSYVHKDFTKHHDFRELLENKDIDAVVIATPDHWHCLTTLHAADAGKDVYCEKPLSTTIGEGQAMIKAVRRNKIVFQGGNMQRSGEHFQEAVQLIRDGYLGKIARAETYIHDAESIEGIGMGDDDKAKYEAKGLDWDFHQGWVEHKPFNTNRWIYNFRWFLDYSGGKITDWGAHLIDIVLWAMGNDEVEPNSVVATGDKYIVNDNRTTPDTLEVVWHFDDYMLSFGNRVWSQYLPEGYQGHGILFHGTLGTMRLDRGGYEIFSVPNNGGCEPKKMAAVGGSEQINLNHWQNFADCIRSRQDPISAVEKLHNTTRTCHLGTCSYAAGGAKLQWDKATQKFAGNDAEAVKKANEWAYREYQNGWSLEAPYFKG